MTTQQQAAEIQPPTSRALEEPPGRRVATEEPAWLWESLRSRIWEPADLTRRMRAAAGLEPERRRDLLTAEQAMR